MIDQGSTLTRSRTRVRSSVITETYAADTNDGVKSNGYSTASAYEPFKSVPKDSSSVPYQVVKYSSLGPNIYARIKTMFDTYELLNEKIEYNECYVVTKVSQTLLKLVGRAFQGIANLMIA